MISLVLVLTVHRGRYPSLNLKTAVVLKRIAPEKNGWWLRETILRGDIVRF